MPNFFVLFGGRGVVGREEIRKRGKGEGEGGLLEGKAPVIDSPNTS